MEFGKTQSITYFPTHYIFVEFHELSYLLLYTSYFWNIMFFIE